MLLSTKNGPVCVYIFEKLSNFVFFHYFSLGPSPHSAGQCSFEKQVLND